MALTPGDNIVGYLLVNSEHRKDVQIGKNFLKKQIQRLVIDQLDQGITHPDLIAENLKGKAQNVALYLTNIMDGVPRTTAKNIQQLITKVKSDRINEGIRKLINSGVETGVWDDDKLKELYFKRESLNPSNNDNQWIKLREVDPRALTWLWFNRIPYSSYSVIGGDPGDGKSIVLTHICAKITQGSKLPDRHGIDPLGSVIYFAAEDNISDTVVVRAKDAGADLEKFIVNPGEKKDGSFFSIIDPEDRRDLETQIKKQGDVRAIVFDPITTFMGGLKSSHSEVEVRAALAPLNKMAERHNLAIIGVGHLNKDQAKSALYRLSGSIAFIAVARTVWLVKKDEDNPNRRFFAPLKYNILKDPTTLAFSITGPIGHPIVEFESMPVDITSTELLADEEGKDRISAVREARIFLLETLEEGGEQPVTDIVEAAKAEGHSERTIRRAKKQLGLLSVQKDRQWYWQRAK